MTSIMHAHMIVNVKHIVRNRAKEASTTIHQLVDWDELPTWMQTDPYIRRGYRRQMNSFHTCYQSLFYPHNEFVNTWSHLLPAVLYLVMLLGVDVKLFRYDLQDVEVKASDMRVVQLYILGTVILLLCSAFFHGTNCHSEAMSKRLLKLDYIGICFGITGTNLSSTYFGLYDHPTLRDVYNAFCLTCALVVLISMMRPGTDGPGATIFRCATFLSLMLSGLVPIVHMLMTQGVEEVRYFPLLHTALMGLCYLAGTVFYVTRWPESCWPEKFDIWGASHQIFHLLVALGQFVFLLGLKKALLLHYV